MPLYVIFTCSISNSNYIKKYLDDFSRSSFTAVCWNFSMIIIRANDFYGVLKKLNINLRPPRHMPNIHRNSQFFENAIIFDMVALLAQPGTEISRFFVFW